MKISYCIISFSVLFSFSSVKFLFFKMDVSAMKPTTFTLPWHFSSRISFILWEEERDRHCYVVCMRVRMLVWEPKWGEKKCLQVENETGLSVITKDAPIERPAIFSLWPLFLILYKCSSFILMDISGLECQCPSPTCHTAPLSLCKHANYFNCHRCSNRRSRNTLCSCSIYEKNSFFSS